MVGVFFRDMQCNMHDFVFEFPNEIKARHKAMEYYQRCVRIREAKRKQKEGNGIGEIVVTEGVTIGYDRIERTIIKL